MSTTPKTRPKTLHKLGALLRFDRGMLADCPEPDNSCVLGLDEVGRGSLIGPVVAGAVCMPETLSRSDRLALREQEGVGHLSAEAIRDVHVANQSDHGGHGHDAPPQVVATRVGHDRVGICWRLGGVACRGSPSSCICRWVRSMS